MTPPPPPPPAPGLREQIGATRDAAKRLVEAHIELLKAEMEEITSEIGRVAALAGVAVAAGLFAGLLLAIGLPLFLGELLFGSIGWGLLLGVELLIGVALGAAIMAAGIQPTRVAWAMLTGFAAGLAVAIILGSGISNLMWDAAGDNFLPLVAEDVRPLATALVVLPVALAILIGLLSFISTLVSDETRDAIRPPTLGERLLAGAPGALYAGWLTAFVIAYTQGIPWFDIRLLGGIAAGLVAVEIVALVIGHWRSGFALMTGLSLGAALGMILAVFTAIAFGWRIGTAIGIAVGLATWIGMLALEATRIEFDEESLKKRFLPQRTIDMTKETIEWARARMPLSRKP
ncbi:MAG TPA: hypothetical protein VFO05_02960 [Candidatus Limnocylindrales bacterium]|nr:hypothetical protein [Candidatus Limnocylindrales bacterium]